MRATSGRQLVPGPGRVRCVAGADLPDLGYAGPLFDPAAIVAARRQHPWRNKPSGGLWLSPVTRDADGRIAGTAWTRWCERCYPRHRTVWPGAALTVVPLRPSARVAVVSGLADFSALSDVAGTVPTWPDALTGPFELDWDGVAGCADALWLNGDGVASLAGSMGEPFYWWSAETVVVLDPGAVGPPGPVFVRSAPARRARRSGQSSVYSPGCLVSGPAGPRRPLTAGLELPVAARPGASRAGREATSGRLELATERDTGLEL